MEENKSVEKFRGFNAFYFFFINWSEYVRKRKCLFVYPQGTFSPCVNLLTSCNKWVVRLKITMFAEKIGETCLKKNLLWYATVYDFYSTRCLFLSPRQLEGLETENTHLVELKSNTTANNEIFYINEFEFEC